MVNLTTNPELAADRLSPPPEQGENGSAVCRSFNWNPRQGIPPQYSEAWKRGTASKSLKAWHQAGMPRSMRQERKALFLEQSGTNSPSIEPTPGEPVIKAIACGCGRQACEACRYKIGMKKKEEMVRTLRKLDQDYRNGPTWMWTLTIDPKKYGGMENPDGPEIAHREVMDRQVINRIAQKVGWQYYTWVLEWQENGWPHWHVLVYEKSQRRVEHQVVEKKWGRGLVNFKASHLDPVLRRDTRRNLIEKGVMYLAGYLAKKSKNPLPDYYLDSDTTYRLIGHSHAWNQIAKRSGTERPEDCSPFDGDRGPSERRTHREAIADCGDSLVLIEEYVSEATGEILNRYLGTVKHRARDWFSWAKRKWGKGHPSLKQRHLRMKRGSPECRQFAEQLCAVYGDAPKSLYALDDQ